MDVLVERYQRRKYVNQEDAPLLYYIRQKSGNVRVMDVDTMATAIESKSSLTAGDVKHTIEAFVEQLRLSLTQGDKVKIDGLGTFHITLTSDGTESMKDCTVRSIRRVNVRFVADKALKLMNSSHTSTRSDSITWFQELIHVWFLAMWLLFFCFSLSRIFSCSLFLHFLSFSCFFVFLFLVFLFLVSLIF